MRFMMAASASAASLPTDGGATTTLAPSVRNSWVNFCSASRLMFRSAEEIAAPLESAIRATVRRPRLARSSCRKIRQNMDPERRGTSSLTPQYGRGINARRALERHQTAQQRHNAGKHQHNGEQNPSNGGSDAKNSDAKKSREGQADRVARNPTNESQQQLLGNKKCADRATARAERLHQSDFRAPFEHRCCRRRAHRERRGKQRRKCYQPHQAAHTRQDSPFSFGHLAYRANFNARKFLLHLVRNGSNVRAAIPAIVFGRCHCGRIALGKSVCRLGQRAYEQAAIVVGTSGKVLRNYEWRENRVVFAAARGNNSGDGECVRACSRADRNRVSNTQIFTPGKFGAYQGLFGAI